MGRPSKLTEFTTARILTSLREGNYRIVACEAAHVDYQTFKRWMADPRPEYRNFRAAVLQAEADCEAEMVTIVRKAAKDDPRLALEYLARKFPERWAAKTRVEIEAMVRKEAKEMAEEYGLDEEQLIAEAQRILSGAG